MAGGLSYGGMSTFLKICRFDFSLCGGSGYIEKRVIVDFLCSKEVMSGRRVEGFELGCRPPKCRKSGFKEHFYNFISKDLPLNSVLTSKIH